MGSLKREERTAILAMPAVLVAGAVIGWMGSFGGSSVIGLPAFATLYAFAFLLQWVVFVPSYLLRSERFFDVTGSLTYISVTAVGVAVNASSDARSLLLLGLIAIWAVRLGTFLLRRVLRAGKDARFDQIKRSFPRLLLTWTLQGLWVSLTLAAALAAITTHIRQPLGIPASVGAALWLVGFGFEVLADRQKSAFRADPANAGRFIQSGLWKWSRHPNYFGEILLWMGIAVIAAPVLRTWQWATLISPVFVTVLLTRISGIPMLEGRANEKWGGRKDYETYKRTTSILIPLPPRKPGP